MSKDIFVKRLKELANVAYIKGIPMFTDFLDMQQQAEYMDFISDYNAMPPVKAALNGGLSFLERKVACFFPKDLPYDPEYPIDIIQIKPANQRFSDDLSHRDFLGALMNLGIERDLLGDILIKDNTAYVFVLSRMTAFICENLFRIRHTTVTATVCSLCDFDYTPSFQEMKGSVASERIDAIIAFAFHMSRSEAALFISSGKVFSNAREITSKGHVLKYGDIVSVRGKGRFIFDEVCSTTKKGRFYIKIRKYV